MANEKFSQFTSKSNLTDFDGIVGYETNTDNYRISPASLYGDLNQNLYNPIGGSGTVLTSNGPGLVPTWQSLPSSVNSYTLAGMIDGVSSSAAAEFVNFGGRFDPITNQGSGFTIFENSLLTHISFKYLADTALISTTASYAITVYESNAGFENLPADTVTSFTALATPITIVGNGAGSSNYGNFPYAEITLATPIVLQANKFYSIAGLRAGGSLFDTDKEAQVIVRITE